MHRKSFHRWNDDSGELDVFEASRYFSGYNEAVGHHGTNSFPQKITREDRQAQAQAQARRGGRISLDIPMRNALALNPARSHGVVDMQVTKDQKKYKQPSSPGGRIASFLNSLFNQTASKKKKKSIKSTTTQSMKDHEEDHDSPGGGGWSKRRSSISHDFRISTRTSTNDSKSLYSSSSSGFRTPPPYANTPTKTYRQLPPTLSKNNNIGQVKSIVALHNEVVDDKFEFCNGLSEKKRKSGNEKSEIWVDRYRKEEKEFKMFINDQLDNGAESDSSSDLFELQNYELGSCYSSGNLPVYETTNIESIKRGAAISNGIL